MYTPALHCTPIWAFALPTRLVAGLIAGRSLSIARDQRTSAGMSDELTHSQAAHLESLLDDDMDGDAGSDPAGHAAFLDDAQAQL